MEGTLMAQSPQYIMVSHFAPMFSATDRLRDIVRAPGFVPSPGAMSTDDGTPCIMQAISILRGGYITDRPPGIPEEVIDAAITLNDHGNGADRIWLGQNIWGILRSDAFRSHPLAPSTAASFRQSQNERMVRSLKAEQARTFLGLVIHLSEEAYESRAEAFAAGVVERRESGTEDHVSLIS